MSFVQDLLSQLQSLWNQSTVRGRIVFGAAAALVTTLVVGVGIWSSQPQYVPLADRLAPSEAAEIISRLSAEGIENKMNFSGSTVLVPKHKWNQARVVAGDIVGEGSVADAGMGDSFLGDPTMNRYKLVRRREQVLASTISQMSGINSATVHIGQSEPSPFIQERRPATASVVLQLRPGATMSREQAAAIVALVSGSVEGLDPENVSVMDTQGHMFSSAGGLANAEISANFEYRRQLEADLSAKAGIMLAQMLGNDRSIVRVTADVDFTRTSRTEKRYDPDNKVRTHEKITSTTITNGLPGTGGAAGTASNLSPSSPLGIGAAPHNEKIEDTDTSYENSSTEDTVTEAPGRTRRLTVAVMADLGTNDRENADAATGATPSAPVTREQIEAIVKQAVGFDPDRGDAIEVLITKLSGPIAEDDHFSTMQRWEFYNRLARSCSLGIAAIVALVLGLMTMRKMKPVTVHVEASPEGSGDNGEVLSRIALQARENPEAIQAVLRSWLSEQDAADVPERRAA